jgi:hypothetical protein
MSNMSNIILVKLSNFLTGPEITETLSTLRGNSCFNRIDMGVRREFNVLTKIIQALCLANIWGLKYIQIF